MILLDTHVLVWWMDSPQKLSKNALREFENARKGHEVCVSSISFWEIALLVKEGRINFSMGFENWIEIVENFSFIRFIPVDNFIAINSVNLSYFSNKDPADRIIVATALNLGAKLITRDRRILKYKGVQAVW